MSEMPIKITVDKLVAGGQGIGILPDGRKCFLWGVLPKETVEIKITKCKKDWAEGSVIRILQASRDRIEPLEPTTYLANSPWQIMTYQKENTYKDAILQEDFERGKIKTSWQDFYQPQAEYGYRNKMEYAFWWDNETERISLALHNRSSHQKVPINGCRLASPAINAAGESLVDYLNKQKIQSKYLKSVLIRSSQQGQIGISLFLKDVNIISRINNFVWPNLSYEIIYSDPKSPASLTSKILYTNGLKNLSDKLLARKFIYTNRSFFQNNLEAYSQALADIKKHIPSNANVADLYCGVGSIGLSVTKNTQKLTLVEADAESVSLARQNCITHQACKVIPLTVETAINYIDSKSLIIVDPPRAGLHKNVRRALIKTKPKRIIYLSCNPVTQVRDVTELIEAGFSITYAKGYNFFPRTPHVEALVVLENR